MFDLKKRSSLTLNCSRDTEEFRRAAVRRKVKGAAGGDCHAVVSSGVFGSYSSGRACDRTGGSASNSKHGALEDDKRSPVKRSPSKPEVPPKPAHLQASLRAGLDKTHGPTSGKLPPQQVIAPEGQQSPVRACGVSVFYTSPEQSCQGSPSPIRGVGGSFLNGVSGAHLSPANHPQGTPKLTSSPVLGSPSPGKRGFQNCSPFREGGHSPAKLSPRNRSPLAGKLRTPSPVQGRIGTYSPAKTSKSWLGLHRISSGKMDRQEKSAVKSLSVPDLIVYLDESRLDFNFGSFQPC
ncbi:uncharacterized protein ACBR49_010816 [Aulostomus maculatus]